MENAKRKYTIEDLKRMQSWDLDTKIAASLSKITEFNEKYANKTYILFVLKRYI